MIVKVIFDKSKVINDILEGSKRSISSILFIINPIFFLFFRKDLSLQEEKEVSPSP